MKIYIIAPYGNDEVFDHVAQILTDRGLTPEKSDLLGSNAVFVLQGCETYAEVDIATNNRIPCFKTLFELMEYTRK